MDFMMLFDMQHVDEGIVCLSSILAHSQTAQVYVLCLQPAVERALTKLGRVTTIPLDSLEAKYPQIARTRKKRPWAPYTQSLKPFLPEYIFNTSGPDALAYVDSDMMFWGDCDAIDKEMEGYSFMVTPMQDEPTANCPCYFNGGCFACRNDKRGREFLSWWQTQCVEWCLWGPGPDGRFSEEGYLNIIKTEPDRFKGTLVCRNPGINLAPWNLPKRKLDWKDGRFMVGGTVPLVCYHYQGLKRNSPKPYGPRGVNDAVVELLYQPYIDLLPPKQDGKQVEENPPANDDRVSLKPVLFENAPQNLVDGVLAEPVLSGRFTKGRRGLSCVLILYDGAPVGIFAPGEKDGVVMSLFLYVDPAHRNKGIATSAIRMYMDGKKGSVGIETSNMASKRAFAAAGFSSRRRPVQMVGGRQIEIWTKD